MCIRRQIQNQHDLVDLVPKLPPGTHAWKLPSRSPVPMTGDRFYIWNLIGQLNFNF